MDGFYLGPEYIQFFGEALYMLLQIGVEIALALGIVVALIGLSFAHRRVLRGGEVTQSARYIAEEVADEDEIERRGLKSHRLRPEQYHDPREHRGVEEGFDERVRS